MYMYVFIYIYIYIYIYTYVRICSHTAIDTRMHIHAWRTAMPSVCCRSWSKSVQDGLPRQATKRGGNRSGGVGRRTLCGGWGVLGC